MIERKTHCCTSQAQAQLIHNSVESIRDSPTVPVLHLLASTKRPAVVESLPNPRMDLAFHPYAPLPKEDCKNHGARSWSMVSRPKGQRYAHESPFLAFGVKEVHNWATGWIRGLLPLLHKSHPTIRVGWVWRDVQTVNGTWWEKTPDDDTDYSEQRHILTNTSMESSNSWSKSL